MRTRPAYGPPLFFEFKFCVVDLSNRVMRAVLLRSAIALIASATAFAQSSQPSQSARDSTVSPTAPPILNFDAPRPTAANSPASASGSSTYTSTISAPSGYQLSTDDQIAIEVFGEEDLRTAARLNAEGAVSLPLLGSIRLAGLTVNQAAARLTELYVRDNRV